ncbi:Glycosyl transferase, family 3-like protein [Gloeothece citriformis PCC 7424]|uniref:Glycosyl transferase, family 3-like protein n=1 Tax=Gloeothece citriformis (strain PCC 7424) TaxID=65393 RepID=B7KB06_GLOC7|nr:anthranilate phosphoribosyltransferase family protein [Gloeothece citriformis]ACK70116.1 Glycosyl transferase, family 3-like protein [Gloeothece citriformis PCC 7424]
MSSQFRELLKKVGSGQHTKENLTRTEAAQATGMMLMGEATAAQIGAFMIAHRIKRITPEELAGMLDAYDELSPHIYPSPEEKTPFVFGIPYDGRSRTAPIFPLTALILSCAGVPAIMHGGDSMPTKYGIPLIELWQGLGLDFSVLAIEQVQELYNRTGLGFIYTPRHFPLADGLTPYRDQIGKRPPIATLELIWSPYVGNFHLVSGYVHPPTEALFRETLKLRKPTIAFTFVKGLEGSCDIRLSQTTIVAISQPQTSEGFEYLKLHPQDYGMEGKDHPLDSTSDLFLAMDAVIEGKASPLKQASIWNGGFYLWRYGICPDFSSGLEIAENLLNSGKVAQKRAEIRATLDDIINHNHH